MRQFMQQQVIYGTVTDSETGEPMPGVNITVKGTTIGTITGMDGKYTISVPDKNATLIFSFIGYINQETPLNGRTNLDVILASEVLGLDEVVVIGYGSQKKVNVIGSITQISNKEMTVAPVSSVSNMLAGRLPGAIFMQGSGDPGNDAATIRIRGNATLGNNSPLIVVDGITDRDINSLNPDDMKAYQCLKMHQLQFTVQGQPMGSFLLPRNVGH